MNQKMGTFPSKDNINILFDMSIGYKLKVISKTCMTSLPPNILDVMYCHVLRTPNHAWETVKKILVANTLHEKRHLCNSMEPTIL